MLNAHFGDPELIAGYKAWMEKGEAHPNDGTRSSWRSFLARMPTCF
jgi:hypothetical protein